MTDLFTYADQRFNGPEYRPSDNPRLGAQITRVHGVMIDGLWRTLSEIAAATGDPEASVSAQLRHLRKERFGSYLVERQPRNDRSHGLFEYRLSKPMSS